MRKKTQIIVGCTAPKYKLDDALVRRLTRMVLGKIGRGRAMTLEVLFVDDRDMRRLNKRFKGRVGTTDVLSFGLGDVGSIAISLDTASRNAEIFGAPLHEETIRYVIHGILHLFGYNDNTRLNRVRMAAKEDRILRSICASTDLSKVLTRR